MTKRLGYIYEQAFFTEALRHGLEVFVPLGDHLPVDCIVVNSAGKKFNVQIKGSPKASPVEKNNGCKRYKFSTTTGRAVKHPLDCTKVDVVGIFCADIETWYLDSMHGLRWSGDCCGLPQQPQSRRASTRNIVRRGKYLKLPENYSRPPVIMGCGVPFRYAEKHKECELSKRS